MSLQLGRLPRPNLPLATDAYDRAAQDALNNVLRLYINNISSTVNNLLGDLSTGTTFKPGGGYLAFPYAAIQRTTNKTFTANTATEVTFDTNDYINYCENDGTNGITVNTAGIYNYQYSVQWVNTDTQIHTGYLWLRVNNIDVPGTASKFDILEKHGGVDGYVIGAANFYVSLNAGDYVSLFAAVSDAAVYMEAYAAQTSPFPMPSIPSVVATLTFVSRLP